MSVTYTVIGSSKFLVQTSHRIFLRVCIECSIMTVRIVKARPTCCARDKQPCATLALALALARTPTTVRHIRTRTRTFTCTCTCTCTRTRTRTCTYTRTCTRTRTCTYPDRELSQGLVVTKHTAH